MAAAKWKLDNLCAMVDVNGLQIDGRTEDVMPTHPLDRKFEAFNWHVITIDGNDYDEIVDALTEARNTKGKPTVILQNGTAKRPMINSMSWQLQN